MPRGEGPERGVRDYERLGIRTLCTNGAYFSVQWCPLANLMILPISWERLVRLRATIFVQAFRTHCAHQEKQCAPHPPLLRSACLLGSVRQRAVLEALSRQLAQIINAHFASTFKNRWHWAWTP